MAPTISSGIWDTRMNSPFVYVLRFNRGKGRDIVMADVHAMAHLVRAGLAQIDFDPEVDRLFLLGDLVDRGPYSDEMLDLLNEPWCFSVRGNHEDAILQCYQGGRLDPAAMAHHVKRNGGAWWLDLSEERRQAHLAAYARMPLVIEVETVRGLVGLVHAEVPPGMDWNTFKAKLEAGDNHTIMSALWGRRRITENDDRGVKGIDRLFSGHTIVTRACRLGNCYFMDAGAFLSLSSDEHGSLTVTDMIAATQVITGVASTKSLWNSIFKSGVQPFSPYVKD